MGFGGGGPTQSTTGSGWGTSSSSPVLYNWKDILPPWVSSGQQKALPWLMNRAATGMYPQEERDLWGQARESIEGGSNQATRGLARQLASSGISPSSGAAAGGFADLAMDKMGATSKAALDFAKMKMGARDTAIGQMLTALYTPSPVAVGQSSTSQYQQTSAGSTSQGGGK